MFLENDVGDLPSQWTMMWATISKAMILNVARDAASTKEDNWFWVVLIDGGSKSQFTENQGRCFGVVPPIMRGVVASTVRRWIRKALYAQGMGQRSRDEIYETGKADLTAVSMWLGDKPFHGNDCDVSRCERLFISCQYPRAWNPRCRSRNISCQFVGLLRADEEKVLWDLNDRELFNAPPSYGFRANS